MTKPLIGAALAALVALAACESSDAPGSAVPSGMESGEVAVENGTLYYETLGRGAPVILIHGGFGDRRMWDGQFEPLSQAFRVIRYDHRGFGRSAPPAGPYSPVADLVRLMDHLALKRANLVGNSMGGTLALDFALLHPDRTGAVVAIASTADGFPIPEADLREVEAVLDTARRDGPAAAVGPWLRHPMVARAMAHPVAAGRVRQMVEENQRVFVMEHWPSEPMTPPAFERIRDLDANVLFVVGDADTAVIRDGAQASAARIKKARVETIAGADHLPQMVEPDKVNKLLVEYISLNGC